MTNRNRQLTKQPSDEHSNKAWYANDDTQVFNAGQNHLPCDDGNIKMVKIGPVELYNLISVRCVLGQDVDDAVKHAQACYTNSPINSGVNVKRRFMDAGVLEWHDNVQIQHDAK